MNLKIITASAIEQILNQVSCQNYISTFDFNQYLPVNEAITWTLFSYLSNIYQSYYYWITFVIIIVNYNKAQWSRYIY